MQRRRITSPPRRRITSPPRQQGLFLAAYTATDNFIRFGPLGPGRPKGGLRRAGENAKGQKIEQLEAKLTRKNEILAELMEEHTLLKKELGKS